MKTKKNMDFFVANLPPNISLRPCICQRVRTKPTYILPQPNGIRGKFYFNVFPAYTTFGYTMHPGKNIYIPILSGTNKWHFGNRLAQKEMLFGKVQTTAPPLPKRIQIPYQSVTKAFTKTERIACPSPDYFSTSTNKHEFIRLTPRTVKTKFRYKKPTKIA